MISINYLINDIWDDVGDDRVLKFYLMKGSPLKVLSIILVYLIFVKIIGPKFMKNRKAYDLRPILTLYNSLLVGLNGIGFIIAGFFTDGFIKTWDCSAIDRRPTFRNQIFLLFGYFYFILKIADLLDTVFFVLRKKQTHITTLHLFHHSVMIPVGKYFVYLKF